MFLPLSPREMAKKGRQRNKRRKGGEDSLFLRLCSGARVSEALGEGVVVYLELGYLSKRK